MLASLRIQNLAIIDTVFLEFDTGFNALTGETGAGKSIIVGALDLLLGGRASMESIREGCERAEVEGLFRVEVGQGQDTLEKMDLLDEDPSTLLIRRVLTRAGRGRITVNGRQVTGAMLRELTHNLVDMSGQHAHYALLSTEEHLVLLDRFGCHEGPKEAYQEANERFKQLRAERTRLRKAERERLEKEDFIRFQLEEIRTMEPVIGEDDELEASLQRMRHAETLREGAGQLSRALSEDGNTSASARLVDAERTVQQLVSKDPGLEPLAERVRVARIEIEDIGYEVSRYQSSIDVNPGQLDKAEDRLSDLRQIKRKYGPSLEAVLEKAEGLEQAIRDFECSEERLETIEADIKEAEQEVLKRGKSLSKKRRNAGKSLANSIESELASLALPKCRFQVRVEDEKGDSGDLVFGDHGLDSVVFEIAPNPGEGFKPLHKVASGGELSRILLAIKAALATVDPVSTSIYDEVDSGIGGGTAEMVGRKLKATSTLRQVLCITHLAQTAAFADRHFHVEKEESDGRTRTRVRELTAVDRADEMARMLGGVTITAESLDHAKEMLESSLSWCPEA